MKIFAILGIVFGALGAIGLIVSGNYFTTTVCLLAMGLGIVGIVRGDS